MRFMVSDVEGSLRTSPGREYASPGGWPVLTKSVASQPASETRMETRPEPWITALRNSHDRLLALAGPLDRGQLEQGSYDSEWTIAQVLSHLGSQAEIFGLFLNAGLTGQDPPGREEFVPIWDAWNAKDPQAQAADVLAADAATLERFESFDAGQRAQLRLRAFGREMDLAGVSRMRLGEHAIHTWDVAVALDPSATVAPDAVSLLIDTIGPLAAGPASRTARSVGCG